MEDIVLSKEDRNPIEKSSRDKIGWLWNKKRVLYSNRIPAVTKVAECNKALTGEGPSMASRSQGWNPSCVDLQQQDRIIRKPKVVVNERDKEIVVSKEKDDSKDVE